METLGRYSLHGLIGSGGMAEVYRATDTSLLREVALKLPHRHLGLDPRARARFLQEGQVVAGLSHENIVHLYDLGEAEDRLYLAMEWVEGQTLEGWLETLGPMPALTALALLMQLLAGLAAAHAKGIMHRDIKPANLLLTREGVLKIADFGLSRLLRSEGLSLSGQFLGTPKYASPELTRGETLTQKSDVYAVGLIALEMLAGKPVITAENPQAALLQIREGRFASSPELCPGAPSAFHATVTAMLQEKADSRPTAREALTSLETFAWERRLRLNPARLAAFIASPQAARDGETRELAALWLEEARQAKAAGKDATAHRHQRLAESLGAKPESRQPGPGTQGRPRESNRKGWPLYSAFSLAISALLFAAGFMWLKPEPRQASPIPALSNPATSPKDSLPAARNKDTVKEIGVGRSKGRETKYASKTPLEPVARITALPIPSAWIRILSRPSFAQIEIDGLALGSTPSAWLPLSPGRHILNLHRENCQSLNETLWVAPAESLNLRRELLRLP